MVVTDSTSGKVLGAPGIGDSPDATGFDATNKVAFSSNGGDATLSVIDTSGSKYPTIQTLKTAKGARTMAFDSNTGRIYLVTAEFGPAPAATPAMPHPLGLASLLLRRNPGGVSAIASTGSQTM